MLLKLMIVRDFIKTIAEGTFYPNWGKIWSGFNHQLVLIEMGFQLPELPLPPSQ